jgi:hypothetical protein
MIRKFCFLGILLIVSFLNVDRVYAQSTQTWSENGIRNIIKEELKGIDIESVRSLIKKESEDFEIKLESRVNQQQNNFIEIIGLFAAVLALIAVNLNIVKTAKNFTEAIWLMIGFTASLSLFATLIHLFFHK